MIERRQRSWKTGSLALMLLAVLSLLVIWPLAMLFSDILPGNATDLGTLRELLWDTPLQHAILRTLAVALLAAGLASLIAIPAAFLAVRASAPIRIMVQVIGFLPLTMPPFVSAAVVQHFTGILAKTEAAAPRIENLDVQGSHLALILVFAVHYLPFVLLSLTIGLKRIDRSITGSASNLGASRLYVWRFITLPLATPTYVAGVSLMLLRIFEDVGTPLMLGIEGMLAPQMVLRLQAGGLSDPLLNITALVLFAATVVVATLAWSALSAPLDHTAGERPLEPMRWKPGFVRTTFGLVLLLGLGVLSLAPHLWLLLMSLGADWTDSLIPQAVDPGGYRQILLELLPGLTTTLAYVAGVGILTLLLGIAFALPGTDSGPFGRLSRFAVTSMFAIPGLVLALAYVHAQGLLGLQSPGFAWLALIVVVALKQLPMAQHFIARRLSALRAGELETARSLGASGLRIGLKIVLPSLAGVLGVAFMLGATAALVELSAVLLLIQDTEAPLALDLFRSLLRPDDVQTAALQGVLLLVLTASALLTLYWLMRRRHYRSRPVPPRKATAARKDP